MAHILEKIAPLVFPWEVDTLTLVRDEETDDDIQVALSVDGNRYLLFQERFSFDANGQITFYGLADLLNDALQPGAAPVNVILLYGESRTVFSTFYGRVNIGMPAADFCRTHFLTLGGPDKGTAPECREYVYLFEPDAATLPETVQVEALYWNGDELERGAYSEPVGKEASAIHAVDVSPARYMREGVRLVAYTVAAGKRRQTFHPVLHSLSVELLFQNAFGLEESFPFPGTMESTVKVTRQSTFINGRYAVFDTEETPTRKVQTGFLSPDMHALFDDLCRSRSVRTATGEEVTLTESESVRLNDEDAFPTGTVTYRSAGRYPVRPDFDRPRLFDNSFDKTFD